MYAFWASSKGYDFSFLGPLLFAGLMGLLCWGFFQIFFPMVSGRGSVGTWLREAPMRCDTEGFVAPGLSLQTPCLLLRALCALSGK